MGKEKNIEAYYKANGSQEVGAWYAPGGDNGKPQKQMDKGTIIILEGA